MSGKTTAGTAIGLSAVFLCLLSLLHVWEPHYNPPHLISEYQLGRHGWLMSLAFICLGAASIALFAAAKSQVPTRGGLFGIWGLLIIGLAYVMAGIFPLDPQRPLAGLLHGIGGLIVIFGSPVVFTLLTIGLAHDTASAAGSRPLVVTATLAWVGLALFCGSIVAFAPAPASVTVGWTNRFMITTYVLWVVVAAFLLRRRRR